MINEAIGFIDIGTCAQVVSKSLGEYVVPLSIMTGVSLVAFLLFAFFYLNSQNELKEYKKFIHKKKLLQEFEDFKIDRK